MTTRLPAWRRYLRFWGSNVSDDVNDELAFHVDMRTKEYRARGMDERAARDAALARVGDLGSAREACLAIGHEHERRQRRATLIESLLADVRYALRSFARTPGWTVVAVLTIALGVGSSTAVFSTVDRLLLHPVDYPGADRIVDVRREIHLGGASVWQTPDHDVVTTWRRDARSIESIEDYARRDLSLGDLPNALGDEPAIVHAAAISSGFFRFAGAHPVIGRDFTDEDAATPSPTAVMLAESFWRARYGGELGVVGKTLRANGRLLTIVGVAPGRLRLPELDASQPDLWLPLTATDRRSGAVARLTQRANLESVARELDLTLARAGLGKPLPGTTVSTILVRPGNTLGIRRALTMLAGAVAMLLLVACANVAHLLLARGATRERELAVRYALGAGRSRLVQQFLCETLVLTLAGGLLAAVVGGGALELVTRLRPASLESLATLSLDRRLVLIAATLAAATGVVVGLLIGVRAVGGRLGESLRVGASGGATRTTARLRSTLVVSEIALSATLLVAALLLVRGVIGLENTPLGFDDHNLYGLTFPLRGTRFASGDALGRELLTRGATIPGLRAITLAETIPPNGGFLFGVFETPEHSTDSHSESTIAANAVAPDYFAVLGIPLIAGHTFDDGSAERNEVVINQSLAARLWPDGSAVGRRFRVAASSPSDTPGSWWTVIGVARNALSHGLRGHGMTTAELQSEPVLFSPWSHNTGLSRVTLVVRTQSGVDPSSSLRRMGSELRAGSSPPLITDVDHELRESIAEPRFAMYVLAAFAALGVLLAAIGLYGVISFTVARRVREIGIRMTLGATPGGIARLVIGDGLRLSGIGVILGIGGAAGATHVLQQALYGIGATDPWSFVWGGLGLIAVSLVACLIPMARATSVDPAVAVRAD
jgi:putative ABC transport system permease protein